MKQLFIFIMMLLLLRNSLYAQVAINSDGSLPNNSAMLDVKSINKGFLPPRMTFVEMNAIINPAPGLMVFCIDCSANSSGTLAMFFNGMWHIFNSSCLSPGSPVASLHIPSSNQIVWNWNTVPWATGYKWNIVNSYGTAIDMGTNISKTEAGLLCNTSYSRYVWAYNSCANSGIATTLTQTTSLDPPAAPISGSHIPSTTQVVWNWNQVVGALGYKWSASNIYSAATDLGTNTSYTETGLTCNTSYTRYIWAYNECGNSTATTTNQTTSSCSPYPTVITSVATAITQTTATSGGNVTSNGGSTVLFRGVCWSTSQNPTLLYNYTTNGSDTGVFVSNLTGLTTNTLYYVRAYAVNPIGTSYGNETTFVTFPTVTTTTITGITQITATSGGNVSAGGGVNVSARGVCWSTITSPTLADSHTTDGTGTGIFTSSLTGLTGNTLYYLRAYATNVTGTSYGNQQTFTTSPILATVTTTPVTLVTLTNATSGGTVTTTGGGTVTARGVCWSVAPNPTTANSKTTDGAGIGAFSSNLTALTPNTLYYVRAYATNSAGTAYGNETTFTTLLNPSIPTVTTTAITNITPPTATSGGNVLSDGGASVAFRGLCWSTNPNPNITDSHTTDGNGTGVFISNMTGLSHNTQYFVRAYAVNNVGTSYGNEISFTTLIGCGASFLINHIAGVVSPASKTVIYGTVTNIPGEAAKCWITSNLGADHQATAVNDATEPSGGWYWQFNRKQGYKHTGSAVTPAWTITTINESSNWITANDPCAIELGNGWRIPTNSEWTNVDASGNWTNWNGPWNSGLKLHAAGYLYSSGGSLYSRGSYGFYWSSTQIISTNGWVLSLYSDGSNMYDNLKAYGFSMRCLKDY
ncbi:MAG: hypothetical protein NT004_12910 [Bacteroidetes bacterium]|nr:hypothetical protein [Bacteroidota bacterium]